MVVGHLAVCPRQLYQVYLCNIMYAQEGPHGRWMPEQAGGFAAELDLSKLGGQHFHSNFC